jgi:uncharacterized protein (DUF2225 family)
MSLKPKKTITKKSSKTKGKLVHSGCGKSNIEMTDNFKNVNPDYVAVCKNCGFPITKQEIVSKDKYKLEKKKLTHFKVDGKWVSVDDE